MKKTTFHREIDKLLENEEELIKNKRMIMVCEHSPNWLTKLGYKDLPIFIEPGHVKSALNIKSSRNNHNISINILLKLPKLLARPVAVFSSYRKRYEILIKATDNDGRIIMVVLETNSHNKSYYKITFESAHYIASIYGKNNALFFVYKEIKTKGLIYPFNKTKEQIVKEIMLIQKNQNQSLI